MSWLITPVYKVPTCGCYLHRNVVYGRRRNLDCDRHGEPGTLHDHTGYQLHHCTCNLSDMIKQMDGWDGWMDGWDGQIEHTIKIQKIKTPQKIAVIILKLL